MNEEKFWNLVDIREITECWEWQACRNTAGYGQFGIGEWTKQVRAHRAAFEFFHGRKPKGWVLHRCNNPGCVNPYHLYEGTPKDNARDAAEAGTSIWVRLRQKIRGRVGGGFGRYKVKSIVVPIVDGPEAWV